MRGKEGGGAHKSPPNRQMRHEEILPTETAGKEAARQEGRNEQLTPLSPVFHSLGDRLRPKWGLCPGGGPKFGEFILPAVTDNIYLNLLEKL